MIFFLKVQNIRLLCKKTTYFCLVTSQWSEVAHYKYRNYNSSFFFLVVCSVAHYIKKYNVESNAVQKISCLQENRDATFTALRGEMWIHSSHVTVIFFFSAKCVLRNSFRMSATQRSLQQYIIPRPLTLAVKFWQPNPIQRN